MVTGGNSGSNYQSLSSTELLPATAPAWVFTGELPSPRYVLSGANIDNKILMTGDYYEIYQNIQQFADKYLGGYGGFNDDYKDHILEFDPVTGQWKEVDKMMEARGLHALAVINFDSGLCVEQTSRYLMKYLLFICTCD